MNEKTYYFDHEKLDVYQIGVLAIIQSLGLAKVELQQEGRQLLKCFLKCCK